MTRSHVNFIMAYESPEGVSMERLVDGFAAMIKDGTVWRLQGSYGRTARALIERGFINDEGDVLDYDPDQH